MSHSPSELGRIFWNLQWRLLVPNFKGIRSVVSEMKRERIDRHEATIISCYASCAPNAKYLSCSPCGYECGRKGQEHKDCNPEFQYWK